MNDQVNNQAELLGEAILSSESYIAMRLAEQAVVNDDEAQDLIQVFSQRKHAFETLMAQKPMNEEAMAAAGEAVKESEEAIANNALITEMRDKSVAYQAMMQQVNDILSRIINGEPEESCSGCCDGCSGCH